jgi:hypothetical protein
VVFQIEMGNGIFSRLHYTTIVRLETCENFHKVPRTNRFSIFKKKSRTLLESSQIWTEIDIDKEMTGCYCKLVTPTYLRGSCPNFVMI